MIKIVLADDHMIVRDGLRTLLELEDDFSIVGDAGTGRQTIEICRAAKPDLLILDLDMPDMDGLDVLKQLKIDGSDVRVIVLTMYATAEYAVRMLLSGASAFQPKSLSGSELPFIIRKVMAGQTCIADDIKDTVLSIMMSAAKRKTDKLSDRELQVFTAYAKGKDRAEIAEMLGISPRTVETHKRRVMEKLAVSNMADLIKAAIRFGIIDRY